MMESTNGETFPSPVGGFEQVAGGEISFVIMMERKNANGKLTGNPDGRLMADDRAIIGNVTSNNLSGD